MVVVLLEDRVRRIGEATVMSRTERDWGRTYTAIPTMLLGMPHSAAELIVVVVVPALVTAAYTHTKNMSAHWIAQ